MSRDTRKVELTAPLRAKDGGMGPKPGAIRTTNVLKDAVLYAAKCLGEDGKGRHGLVGYLMNLGRTQPVAFASLLGRVLPYNINAKGSLEVVHTFRSREEVRAELRSRGIIIDGIYSRDAEEVTEPQAEQ